MKSTVAALLMLAASFALNAQTHSPFAVTVTGHGKPIILIPGLSSSGETWSGTVSHLQARYTCHVLTLAGFAGQPPIDPPLLSTVRKDLAAYIERNHLKKPVIVGHSLGGNVALGLAVERPDLVGPVIIVDSLPFLAGAWFHVGTLKEAAPMIDGMHAFMAAQSRQQYEQYARSGASVKNMAGSQTDVERLIAWGLASDQATVVAAMEELLREDSREQMPKIASPVLVLGSWIGLREQMKQWGVNLTEADVSATFRDQYAGLARLHFEMAPNARHFIMWDSPDWFFQRLDAFLADPDAAVKERGFAKGSDGH